MLLAKPAPPNKRKKLSKIITDLAHITQDEFDSEPEASEFDLGTKIRTPRDIMLEELSLMNNRGSKMFKMRQKRVEKFIYENNPDLFCSESMDNLQKLVPSLGGQVVDGCHYGSRQVGWLIGGGAPVPPPKPGSKVGAGAGAGGAGFGAGGAAGGGAGGGAGGAGAAGQGGSIQGGTGIGWTPLKGGGMDDPTNPAVARSYQSPWEKAMKGDESLTSTLKTKMPGPCTKQDLVQYKCFNRSAMPFGGYEKANMLMKFQLPDKPKEEEEPMVYQHEIGCRPSFNRTPIGWLGSSEPSSIHMETETVPFDGETDEL